MKFLTIGIFLFFFMGDLSQENPFFEQIAFTYFQDSILQKLEIKNSIYLETKVLSYQPRNNPGNLPVCFGYSSKDSATVNSLNLGKTLASKSNIFNFKTSKIRNSFKCHVAEAIMINSSKIVVNVVLTKKAAGDIYHIELDKKGEIIRWCKGGWIE